MSTRQPESWEPPIADRTSIARPDRIGTGAGLAMVGLGLICLAGAESARIFLDHVPAQERVALREPAPTGDLLELTDPADPMGTAAPAPQAVGTGPGSPAVKAKVPPRSGGIVGLAANPIPNGTSIFRVWGSGRLEAMITTEDGVWGHWIPVQPGFSTDMRRPQVPEDPNNPE